MRLKPGRGYVSAEFNNDEDLSVGYIPIDSVHTPIKKVNYNVEKTRQGSNTEYDRLTIEVWTDGSVAPEDSIGLAAKLVKDHMSIFINFEEEEEEYKYEDIARPPLMRNDLLDKSVDELELSVRSYNCLKNADIRSIRRPHPPQRKGHARHQELWQKIADRDQGPSARNGPRFRDGF
jgi:DNA-directed RNA polymerase subunit alpha